MSSNIESFVQMTLGLVGAVVLTGGGITLLAYKIFEWLGQKWLESKFAERLESLKHVQQLEIEKLRLEINTLLDRTVKLHQREFDVLPEAWGLLTDAFAEVHNVGLGIVQYDDVNRMNEEHLEEFLKNCHLMEWQKTELRAARDKTRYYGDAIAWRNLGEARRSYGKFHLYFQKNGIFIQEKLKSQFLSLGLLLRQVLAEREVSMNHPQTANKFEKGMELHESGQKLLNALEAEVQNRLWSSISGAGGTNSSP
jgi:hypothetical protein